MYEQHLQVLFYLFPHIPICASAAAPPCDSLEIQMNRRAWFQGFFFFFICLGAFWYKFICLKVMVYHIQINNGRKDIRGICVPHNEFERNKTLWPHTFTIYIYAKHLSVSFKFIFAASYIERQMRQDDECGCFMFRQIEKGSFGLIEIIRK